MKIVIYAIITIEPERRKGLLDLVTKWIPEVHKQNGCLRYDWTSDSIMDNQILVFEEWENAQALEDHFSNNNFSSIGKILGEYGILGASARKFTIEKEGPVFNAAGVPTSEF